MQTVQSNFDEPIAKVPDDDQKAQIFSPVPQRHHPYDVTNGRSPVDWTKNLALSPLVKNSKTTPPIGMFPIHSPRGPAGQQHPSTNAECRQSSPPLLIAVTPGRPCESTPRNDPHKLEQNYLARGVTPLDLLSPAKQHTTNGSNAHNKPPKISIGRIL